jgi:hypothetical protein
MERQGTIVGRHVVARGEVAVILLRGISGVEK